MKIKLLFALIGLFFISCTSHPYQDLDLKRPTGIPVLSAAKDGEPYDPCPECPHCTNCWQSSPPTPVDTNAIWIGIIDYHLDGPPAAGPYPYYLVTEAHNLTNGHRYIWERSLGDGPIEWLPVAEFVATNSTAIHTNAATMFRAWFFRI